jgi:hypothetical protein
MQIEKTPPISIDLAYFRGNENFNPSNSCSLFGGFDYRLYRPNGR